MAAPRPEVAVGAVVVDGGRLLVVRRGRGAATGLWSLPGGRLEPGETLEDGVVREVAEETGLTVSVAGLCGVAERRFADAHYVILDYWCVLEAPGEATAGDDAAEVRWVGRTDLDDLPLVPRLTEFLAEHGVLDRMR